MCFNCGFTSNSMYKPDSEELKKASKGATQLMIDISFYDTDRDASKVQWSLEIDDVVVTIYDWYVKSQHEHNMLWMIGGREPKALDKYKEAMQEHGKRKLDIVKQHFGRDNDKLLVC